MTILWQPNRDHRLEEEGKVAVVVGRASIVVTRARGFIGGHRLPMDFDQMSATSLTGPGQ